jgi:signal transduction histidine kinase
VLTVLSLVRSFWVWNRIGTHWDDPTIAIALGAGAVVAGFSGWVLLGYRERTAGPALFVAATFVDAGVCFAALSTNVFWPGNGSPGLLRLPDLASTLIATGSAALRLSPLVCLLAGALNLLSLSALIALAWPTSGLRPTELLDVASALVALLVAATVTSALCAWLARRLVLAGALRALEAERAERSLGVVMQEHHDVRTLLSSASLNADLLLERVRAGDPGGEGEEIARQLRSDLDRVNEFVAAIKERSLGELLALEAPAPAQPGAVAAAVARDLAVRFPDVEIAVRDDAPETIVRVRGGPRALARVLQNLVVNACEGDGLRAAGRVDIGIAASGDDVRIEVRDDGPGFRTASRGAEPAPGVSSKQGGSGLGLTFVREIAEASGGRLAIANAAGGGACVSVELARDRAPGPPRREPAAADLP